MATHARLLRAPIFCPSIAAFPCGMLVNVPLHYSQLSAGIDGKAVHAALTAHFGGEQFVRVHPLNSTDDLRRGAFLTAHTASGDNSLELFVWDNPAAGTCLITARLDNLGKGASGQAVQNMNILLNVPESTGLV